MAETENGGRLSTTEAVGVVVRRNYVLNEALRMKVVNFHALAGRIAPRVEDLMGSRPKTATLVVAIKRFSDRIDEQSSAALDRILEGASVTLTGGVVELTILPRGRQAGAILSEIAKLLPRLSGAPEVVLLTDSLKMLMNRDDGKVIKKELGRRYPTTLEEGLAKVGVRLDQRAQALPGIATFITELLFRSGVTLRSAYVGRPETLFVVEEKFATKTYNVLREAAAGE